MVYISADELEGNVTECELKDQVREIKPHIIDKLQHGFLVTGIFFVTKEYTIKRRERTEEGVVLDYW